MATSSSVVGIQATTTTIAPSTEPRSISPTKAGIDITCDSAESPGPLIIWFASENLAGVINYSRIGIAATFPTRDFRFAWSFKRQRGLLAHRLHPLARRGPTMLADRERRDLLRQFRVGLVRDVERHPAFALRTSCVEDAHGLMRLNSTTHTQGFFTQEPLPLIDSQSALYAAVANP